MRPLGPLIRLQIQRSSLKTGEKPTRTYDPAPLLPVHRLAVSADGVLGASADGGWVVDVHHRSHPATKNSDGLHGVSVGFTAHYGEMRRRFGERLTLGCAGENLIAETAGRLSFDDVCNGFAVMAPDGSERVRLRVLEVAHPCRPFTGWALGGGGTVESSVLKEHLQFLEGGMRGFYCVGEGAGIVEIGDSLVAL
jgi:hypothetical protein